MNRKKHWAEVVWDVVVQYTQNSTISSYQYLTASRKQWSERIFWVGVNICGVWLAIGYTLQLYEEYLSSPTVTTIETTTFPVWREPFPAVAICNFNRISHKAATDFSATIAKKLDMSEDSIYDLLKELGRLYDYNPENPTKLHELHNLLLQYNESPMYNLTDIMLQLTPRCDDMLQECYFAGKRKNCTRIFQIRRTMDGFCCIFNYMRESDETGGHVRETAEGLISANAVGALNALILVVDHKIEDYMYSLFPSYGIKVLTFSPWDFPERGSGGVNEKLVSMGEEAFLRVSLELVTAAEELRSFDIASRGCLFFDDMFERHGTAYSRSECLIRCRAEAMLALCGCLPFNAPIIVNSRPCSVLDTICLANYRVKWATQRPPADVPGLEAEKELSISCDECLPECPPIRYSVQLHSAEIRPGQMSYGNLPLTNHSVIHVYFRDENCVKLRHDVLYFWYDLVSRLGGACSLFIGFSLVSAWEIFYFFTLRLVLAIHQENQRKEIYRENSI